jgi:glycogen debranching enzyme
MKNENPGRRLVNLRPRNDTTYVSQGRTVLAADRDGYVRDGSERGLFFHETRILSKYKYCINGEELIASAVSNVEQHSWLGYYITYPPEISSEKKDEGSGAVKEVSQNTLELRISRYIGEGMHEDLDLTNFTQSPTLFQLTIELDADFADQIETLQDKIQSGEMRQVWKPGSDTSVLEFFYVSEHTFDHQGNKGTARIQRGVAIELLRYCSIPDYQKGKIIFQIRLPARGSWHACINVIPVWEGERILPAYSCHSFDPVDNKYDRLRVMFLNESTVFTNPAEDTLSAGIIECFHQARNDLAALRLYDLDADEHTWITAAGLPMYIAIFGRDTLTTALQAALLNQRPLFGTLSELTKWQGKEMNEWRDEEPGRMLHEAHTGPLALLNFNPRSRYYGSVTTSGFYPVVLAELWHWTGDKDAVRAYLPAAKSALEWLQK